MRELGGRWRSAIKCIVSTIARVVFSQFFSRGFIARVFCALLTGAVSCEPFRAASRVISMSAHASLDLTCLLLCKRQTSSSSSSGPHSFSRLISSAECCACFFTHTHGTFLYKMAIEGGRALFAATVFTVVAGPPACVRLYARTNESYGRRNAVLRDLSRGGRRKRARADFTNAKRRATTAQEFCSKHLNLPSNGPLSLQLRHVLNDTRFFGQVVYTRKQIFSIVAAMRLSEIRVCTGKGPCLGCV